MKILVLTNLYPPHYIGGYELICQTVVEILRARGHQTVILTSDHATDPDAGRSLEPGIERTLQINGLYGHPWRGGPALCRLEKHNNDALRGAIARHKPELVYVWNMGGLSKSMLFTLQRVGIPTVFYLSDHWMIRGLPSDVWLRWWNGVAERWPQRLLRAASSLLGLRRRWDTVAPTNPLRHLHFRRIYFCSRALRELTAAAGYDVKHGAVIYCPVHSRFFHGTPPEPRPFLQRLLYVGRLSEDKGVITALRALALLRGKCTGQLSVFGRGEPDYVARLKSFALENSLNVIFASAELEQMPRIYREHDLLLFTSEWDEPFALTPIEAMASGLPVLGTATGGSVELFRDEENALVFPAGDVVRLADGIARFASDYGLRARCAQTGYSEARERYTAPVIVDQIEQYLEESLRLWQSPRLPLYSSQAF